MSAAFVLAVAGSASCRTMGEPGVARRGAGAVSIVQPGAPGEPGRTVTSDQASDLSRVSFTPADVEFMRGMIRHHGQAIQMTDLIASRTASGDLRKLGLRIALSQADEISMMKRWLEVRGQEVSGEHTDHRHGILMPGMLTPEQMERLAAAHGPAFDRLFLEGMIEHHGGALAMVDELFSQPGAAQDSEIFAFASDVNGDQRMEIARMGAMLKELP
ncbi:MAG: DUF305 domain-containing protein [Luteitalea sp.]|nr:DUF305 domain-containing protein [Luteitalea sp.]